MISVYSKHNRRVFNINSTAVKPKKFSQFNIDCIIFVNGSGIQIMLKFSIFMIQLMIQGNRRKDCTRIGVRGSNLKGAGLSMRR